jgi:cytidylate kinase
MSRNSSTAKLVERQMRNWELARQQRIKLKEGRAPAPVADFVTVSQAVGSTGEEVARKLAERLGWPLFDKEILQHMAGDDQVRTRLYEKMDERDTNWLEHMIRNLLQGEYRKEDYSYRLSEAVLALARQGPAVFLGRGADFVLPQDRGLRVRLLAPDDFRIATYAQQHQCDIDTARSEIARIEREREDFFRRCFGKLRADPTRFDLMINLGRMSHDEAVEMILAALRLRGVRVSE